MSSPHSNFTKVKLGPQMKGLLEEVFGSFQLGKHHGLTIFFSSPMPYTNFPEGRSVSKSDSVILKKVFLKLPVYKRYCLEIQNFYVLGN